MKKTRSLDPLLLIGAVVAVAALLTWILPAGRFERVKEPATGRTVVLPGSYQTVPQNGVGPWAALVSIPEGLVEAAEVIFFVLLAGGALTVVEATGAIGNLLNQIVCRFGTRPLLVLALASILFLIGGAANNMYEEILAFIPLLCALMRRIGLENEMALGVSVGTATIAASFSPVNTFMLGISQPMAQLPLFSGFAFRSVFFFLAMIIWAAYLAWYALRYRIHAPHLDPPPADFSSNWNPRDLWVIAAMMSGMATLVLGGVLLHWELRQFGAVFLLMGFVAGLAGGLGWRGSSEQFAEGFRRMALAAALVGFARALSVVLSRGLVLDTIANALFSPLQHLSISLAAVMMLVSESALAIPMSSDSGRAMMSLPVILPLVDLLGVSRQIAVTAYQCSGLVSGLITPTAGALLAMLAIADVSYARWLRFIALPFALLFALAMAAMVIGVNLGIQ